MCGKAGYTTVEIEPITLHGDKFVIAIKSKKTAYSDANFGIENNDGDTWKNATNEKGQTYFSLEGKEWYDIKELETPATGINKANVSIKAFSEETSLGDINLDEEFDIRDLSASLLYFSNNLEEELSEQARENLDINQDGNVDMMDLSKIILILAKIE